MATWLEQSPRWDIVRWGDADMLVTENCDDGDEPTECMLAESPTTTCSTSATSEHLYSDRGDADDDEDIGESFLTVRASYGDGQGDRKDRIVHHDQSCRREG